MKQMLAMVVVGLLVAAAPQKDDGAKKDKLQGTWVATSIEHGGTKAPEDQVQNLKLTFTDGKATMHHGTDNKEAAYKVDATKKPATIDLMPSDGPEAGKTMKGIYELTGDTLKIAMLDGEGERPTEFASKAGTKQILITFKREKK